VILNVTTVEHQLRNLKIQLRKRKWKVVLFAKVRKLFVIIGENCGGLLINEI
jgi:hypothetical protein